MHLENSITQHRPVAVGETVDVAASVGPSRPHPKGTVYDFVTVVTVSRRDRVGGDVVVPAPRAGRRVRPGRAQLPRRPSRPLVWRLPADLGRTYAAVSGDHNPIHLYAITAKALGFPRQIAHGMWTMARCVAALENRIPDAATVEVAFKRPVLLPGSVAFGVDARSTTASRSRYQPRRTARHTWSGGPPPL